MATRKPGHFLQAFTRQVERPVHAQRRCIHSDRRVQEHDLVLLRQRGDKKPKWRLAANVRAGRRIPLPHGAHVMAEDLIGRRYLDKIVDSKGNNVVIHEATLASYVLNADRMATPIYPHDAGTIVAMMDLHPERPEEGEREADAQEPFEVFEAGTGMGSLSLHIARALHAGNKGMSKDLRAAIAAAEVKRIGGSTWSVPAGVDETGLDHTALRSLGAVESLTLSRLDVPEDTAARLQEWRDARRYVLHTLDRNVTHAREAWRFLREFRGGMYLPNIDVHIGSVDAWMDMRLAAREGRPFLSRAMLDMPSPQSVGPSVVRALRTNGLLVVFNPSISQIAEFSRWAVEDEHGRLLKLEKVIELPNTTAVGAGEDGGMNDGGGGKAWDVKTVASKEEGGGLFQVMRPKVGDRVGGGGFVAVYRKWPPKEERQVNEAAMDAPAEGQETEIEEKDVQAPEQVTSDGEETGDQESVKGNL